MGIANKLRELMCSKDINANELAKMIDVTPSTIYSILQRDSKSMNLDLVMKIAHALGVSTDELLGRSGTTRYLSEIEINSSFFIKLAIIVTIIIAKNVIVTTIFFILFVMLKFVPLFSLS